MDVNIVLFPDFETLDVFGPVEIFGHIETYRLQYISISGGWIRSRHGADIMTIPFDRADPSGILLVPGGQGTRPLVKDDRFIADLGQLAKQSAYCLAVCTGSALLARTSLLDGKRATSNKKALEWVKSVGPAVDWVDRARWVRAGRFYTSSGVSAGMDMALGFIADQIGSSKAEAVAEVIEYTWNPDMDDDPFAR